jgi:hypothetical protein
VFYDIERGANSSPPQIKVIVFYVGVGGDCPDQCSPVPPGDVVADIEWHIRVVRTTKLARKSRNGDFGQIEKMMGAREFKNGVGVVDSDTVTRWMADQVWYMKKVKAFANDDDPFELVPGIFVCVAALVYQAEQRSEIAGKAIEVYDFGAVADDTI